MELEQFLGHMDTQDFFGGKRWFNNKGNQWLTRLRYWGERFGARGWSISLLIGKLKRPRISSKFFGGENHSSGDRLPDRGPTNITNPKLLIGGKWSRRFIRQQCSEKLWPVLSYSMPYQKVSTLPSWSFLDFSWMVGSVAILLRFLWWVRFCFFLVWNYYPHNFPFIKHTGFGGRWLESAANSICIQ